MKRVLFIILISFLTFELSALESTRKVREVIYLWDSGKKEEALKAIEPPFPIEREEFSNALYLFSINLYEKGDKFYTKKFLKKALEVNPELWRGWSFLAFVELKSGNIHLFFKYLPRTFLYFLKEFKNQIIIFSILLKSFFISVLISLFILSIFLLVKYLPLIRDDISNVVGEISFKSGKLLSYLFILILPAILFLGWALASIIFIAFAWSFLITKERRLTIVAILLLIFGIIGNQVSISLIEEIANSGNDSGYLTFNASKSIENGEFEKGIGILEEINKRKPNLFSLVTLGNIRLKEGKYEESRKLFERALMLYPNSEIPYSNLSILFEKTGEIQYAEKYREKAKALKGRVEELIWPEFSYIEAWKTILKERLNSKSILSSELFFVLGVVFFGVLINFILKLSPRLYGESRFCLSCRKSINFHFDLKITNPDYCEECYRLFVWKPPELEIVRASKSKEIKRKRFKELNIYRIISIFIPYSGLIRYDKPSTAYFGLIIFAFLLSSGFLLKGIEPFSISFTFVLLFIIVYVIGIFIFEKKVREEWKEL